MKIKHLITPDVNTVMFTPSLRMTLELNDPNIEELFRLTDLNNLSNNDTYVNDIKPGEESYSTFNVAAGTICDLNNTSNTLAEMDVDDKEKTIFVNDEITPSRNLINLTQVDPNLIFQSQSNSDQIQNSSQLNYHVLVSVTNNEMNVANNEYLVSSESNSSNRSTSNSSDFKFEDKKSNLAEQNFPLPIEINLASDTRSNGSVIKPYKATRSRKISLSKSESNQNREKKWSASVQKRVDEILARGKEPAVFGNRVVEKYSDEYFKLRERNDIAVENSRKKKEDEKRDKELELERIIVDNEQLKKQVNDLTHEVKFLRELFGVNFNNRSYLK